MKKILCLVVTALSGYTLAFGAPADSVQVNPLNPKAGATSIYQISFVAADTLFPNGSLTLTFPQAFDLSGVRLANSTTINGGFRVKVQGQQVILIRTGLGRMISPNERVEVKFANVKNPQDTQKAYSVKVE
ncbi:MAG: hypothetical protein ACE5HO_07300, partial [bacterium]